MVFLGEITACHEGFFLRQKRGEIQGSEDAVVERSNLIDPGREGALYEEANPGYLLSAGKKVVFSAGRGCCRGKAAGRAVAGCELLNLFCSDALRRDKPARAP